MNHKTGNAVTKNGKTGTIIDRAPIHGCWEVKWGEGNYTFEQDETLAPAPDSKTKLIQPPSLVVLSSFREGMIWKAKTDNYSQFVKNKAVK